ncbi:MAG: acyl carrier protein [Pseudomonadales bacterium]|jgi:acyl carrier protein|nr:acyl carrier protein [Pseudomonadales bacterium]
MDTFETLRQIIADKSEKDPAEITLDATFETLGIDSLDTFDIIFEAEEKFGIKVPNDEVAIKTVQDVVNLIDQLRAAQGA